MCPGWLGYVLSMTITRLEIVAHKQPITLVLLSGIILGMGTANHWLSPYLELT